MKSPYSKKKKKKTFKKIVNELDKFSTKGTMNDIIKPVNDSKNFIKALKSATDNFFGIKITLTDNEIKDIIKVIKSLENREILLKGTTRKCTSQGGFLSFVRPLMTAGLPLMKSVLIPLASYVLLHLDFQQKCQQQIQ